VDAGFITEFLNVALRLDAKLSSHPVEVECTDANMINQVSPVLVPYSFRTDAIVDLRQSFVQ
jgi:hypothetical protein